jgi:uncharacterized protein (DUF1800 family)
MNVLENVDVWAPYVPSDAAPWNRRRVVHLHRRAGFAATEGEIERDLSDGPQISIDRLLNGHTKGRSSEEFEAAATRIAESADAQELPQRLKAWWMFRMLEGPDPLGERLTLLWHNHFATSNLKLSDLGAMRRQNELLRRHARGRFSDLLRAVVRDPAMLLWLDAPENRKGRPNENLARELLELFTLGIGHYTEDDVKEAARALTGWTVKEGSFFEEPQTHDSGRKTLLGRSGELGGDGVLDIALEHPATADRLVWRLCEFLMGEGVVTPAQRAPLAAGLRARELDLGWAVAAIVRSAAFFSDANIGSRVVGPAEFVIGSVRALELTSAPVNPQALAAWSMAMGQDLFYPPNVGGWPGGRSWLTARAVIARANFATALAEGGLWPGRQVPNLGALAQRLGERNDPDAVLAFVSELLLGTPPRPEWSARLASAIRGTSTHEAASAAVALVLSSPQYQLG